MKRIIALLMALTIIVGCCSVSYAYDSKTRSNKSCIPAAVTAVKAQGITGTWTNDANGSYFVADGVKVAGWRLIKDQRTGTSSWYFFDENGRLKTGWLWIRSADGLYRCYCLDSKTGACYMNGRTPDGYFVDKNGAWTKGGAVQTRAK